MDAKCNICFDTKDTCKSLGGHPKLDENFFHFIKIIFLIFCIIVLVFAYIIVDARADKITISTDTSATDFYLGMNSGGDLRKWCQGFTFANTTSNITGLEVYFGTTIGTPSTTYVTIKNGDYLNPAQANISVTTLNNTAWNYFKFPNGVTSITKMQYACFDLASYTTNVYYLVGSKGTDYYTGGNPPYFYSGTWSNLTYEVTMKVVYQTISGPAGITPNLTLNWNLSNGTWTNYNYTVMAFNGSITNNSEFYNCTYKYGNTQIQSWDSINLSNNWNNTFDNFPTLQWVNISLNCSNLNATNYKSVLYYFNWTITPPIDQSQNNTYLLNQINTKLDNLRGDLETAFLNLSLVILWLGLWIFGYYAITTKNELLGVSMIVLTLPINVYFAYIFREVMNLGTGFIGVGFIAMSFWMFGIILYTRRTVSKV